MIYYNSKEASGKIYGASKMNKIMYGKTQIYPDYIKPPSFEGKWLATYADGHTASAECDASSAITEGEINLTNLTAVEIGDCATGFTQYTFYNCGTLKDVVIGNGIETIGTGIFYKCTGLTSVSIGSGVTTIGYVAFGECKSLTSVTIPDSVTTIKESDSNYSDAFKNCINLQSVTIGSGITSIGIYAFYGCSSLTGVTIYATTPPTLGSEAFNFTNNCPIYVPSGSVDTYKAASGWSTLADRIFPIQ